MSLIIDENLELLWQRAQSQTSNEWASIGLWNCLWNKYLFTEKEWMISPESPPEGHGRRRVDIKIEYKGGDGRLAVLAFHEAKASNAGPKNVEEAEDQALDACKRYLGEHPELQFVYAWTTFGTKARAWQHQRGKSSLEPLFGSNKLADRTQYIELHSSEAQLIRRVVQMMKVVRPSM